MSHTGINIYIYATHKRCVTNYPAMVKRLL
uniref:Uncharacterized protein n=1 Tax=Anguilla anguilla TaxID=7936 RepID=A0A0E9SRM9_ANGAN